MTAAQAIATELRAICTEEQIARYRANMDDESGGYDSLRNHESLVRIRLGGDYDASAWDDAMEILRG